MRCAIWYHLYNLKTWKTPMGECINYQLWTVMFRSNYRRCSAEKDVLRNFTKFTEKHLCQVAGLRPATLLKKSLWHSCLSVNFVKFLRIPFPTEHLWWLLLYIYKKRVFINSKITQSQCFCKLVDVGESNCEIDIN